MFVESALRRLPPEPLSINRAHSLASGLVFAWAGSLGVDLVGGIRPTINNVTLDQSVLGKAWRFSNHSTLTQAQGFSDLNFGTVSATAALTAGPSTYAFLATVTLPNLCGFAAQNDGVNSNGPTVGWQIYCTPSSGLACSFGRSVTNVQNISNQSLDYGKPAVVVVTFDGANLRSGSNIYLNGRLCSVTGGTNGSGTATLPSSQNLYLGRRRFDTALSHSGDIIVALLANRIWTLGEINEFTKDPFVVFAPRRATVYSRGFSLPTTVFDAPDSAAAIFSDATVVFDVTAAAGFSTATALVTDSVVTNDPAWSLAGGFVAPYYGTNVSIQDGYRVYLHRTGGWRNGSLKVDLAVTDLG